MELLYDALRDVITDEDAYLPETTVIWCSQMLRQLGHLTAPRASDFISTGPDKDYLIPPYYERLVAAAHEYWRAGNQNPKLGLLKVPRGGYNWVLSQRVVHELPNVAEHARDLVEDSTDDDMT